MKGRYNWPASSLTSNMSELTVDNNGSILSSSSHNTRHVTSDVQDLTRHLRGGYFICKFSFALLADLDLVHVEILMQRILKGKNVDPIVVKINCYIN